MSQAKSLFLEIRHQKCGKSLVFLDPDPADLREGCQFPPPPEIQATRPGDANQAGFRFPPCADIDKEQ